WVRCISEHHARFAGRSEREIQLASAELRRRQQRHGQHLRITARQLADFLGSLEAEEAVLEQRLRDSESRSVLHPLVGDPGFDRSAVTTRKAADIDEAGLEMDEVLNPAAAARTGGEELVVYEDC